MAFQSQNTAESTDPIVRLEADLLRFTPYRSWEIVQVTFPATPNSDVTIPHSLTPSVPEAINYQVLQTNAPMMVYHANSTQWTNSSIKLRSTTANGKAIVLLTTSKESNPFLEAWNGTESGVTIFRFGNLQFVNPGTFSIKPTTSSSWGLTATATSIRLGGSNSGTPSGSGSITISASSGPTGAATFTGSTGMLGGFPQGSFGTLRQTVISDSITASKDDYNPTGWTTASVLLVTTDANRTIYGMDSSVAYSNWSTTGRIIYIVNNGTTYNLTLAHAAGSSSAANRFNMPYGDDVVLGPGEGAKFVHNGTNWSYIGRNRTFPSGRVDVGSNVTTSLSSAIRFKSGSAQYNWQIGANINFSDVFEITPSTATGGSTFSTPSMTLTRLGNLEVAGDFIATSGLLRLTSVSTSAGDGDIVIPYAKGLRVVNSGGTDTFPMMSIVTGAGISKTRGDGFTVADLATQTLFAAGNSVGLLTVVNGSNDTAATFMVSKVGGTFTVTELNDPDNAFSATAGTANSTNVYFTGGNCVLENRHGASKSYTASIVGN